MVNLFAEPEADAVCVFDDKSSALDRTAALLSSAGLKVRPFGHANTLFEYARIHRLRVALIVFAGSKANGLEIAAQWQRVSPATAVLFSLRVHRGEKKPARSGGELINLIYERCMGIIQTTDRIEGALG